MKLVDIEALEAHAQTQVRGLSGCLERCRPEQLAVIQAELRIWRSVLAMLQEARKP